MKQDEEHRREHEEERLLEAGEPLPTEETSLIPDRLRAAEDRAGHNFHLFSKKYWNKLPARVQASLTFLGELLNAPLVGAVIGALIGLINPLHRVFFNETFDGGWPELMADSITQEHRTAIRDFASRCCRCNTVLLSAQDEAWRRRRKRSLAASDTRPYREVFVLACNFNISRVDTSR